MKNSNEGGEPTSPEFTDENTEEHPNTASDKDTQKVAFSGALALELNASNFKVDLPPDCAIESTQLRLPVCNCRKLCY